MTNPIPFPVRHQAADAFTIPLNAAEFLRRFPQHIRNVLRCWSQHSYLSVGNGDFVELPSLISPYEIGNIAGKVRAEMVRLDVVYAFQLQHGSKGKAREFFDFIHAYIYSFVEDREPARQTLPVVELRTLQIVTPR